MESAHSVEPRGREDFIKKLMESYGVKEKQQWQNNNGTVSQLAYIWDVKKIPQIQDLISILWNYNIRSNQAPVVAATVAGWAAKDPSLSFISETTRNEHLLAAYAKSFSLSPFTTGKNADIIIRISKEAQKVIPFVKDGKYYVTVTPGCRITDIEKILAESKLAFPPHMPTLDVGSYVGTSANCCYGPGKNFTSMTSDIIELKVISPRGEPLTLSATEHPELFSIFRDGHLGAAFIVVEVTIANIVPDFNLKRTDRLFRDAEEFEEGMRKKRLLDEEHFIMHFIPVAMNHKDRAHFPRYRVSTFKRTIEAPSKGTLSQQEQDLSDWEDLIVTETGEKLIGAIVNSTRLQPGFDILLEFAAKKTFGDQMKKVEIGGCAETIHLLKTYTASLLIDVNWLIQVPDVNAAQDILITLVKMVEDKLKACAEEHEYPLLTCYSRFCGGLYYPPGEGGIATGGIATTAVDHEGHSILSFELLTYPPLDKKEGFKAIQKDIIKFLNENHFKFKYHPGKTWPNDLTSLTQIFKDKIDQQRLANFQQAVIEMHGGRQNIQFSPLLTPQKKEFIFGHLVDDGAHNVTPKPAKITPKAIKSTSKATENDKPQTPRVTSTQRKQARDRLVELSIELGHDEDHLSDRLNKGKENSMSKKKAKVIK